MKKHQLAAMVLSALSAGFLISCSKSNDTQTNEEAAASSQENDAATTSDSSNSIATQSSPTATQTSDKPQAVALPPKAVQSYLQHVVEQQIIPTYAQAAKQSQVLHDMAAKQCQHTPLQGDDLQKLRAQWLILAQAWASAEMVNFGPATESMTNLYINYYPDERGLVHQGVIDLVAANPELKEDALLHESAIVQGIPGLEEILYANDSLDQAQCHYVIGASAALSTRLNAIEQEWQKNGTQLLDANDSEEDSADSKAGLNRWINSLLSLVETAKSTALDKPLGLTGSKKGHLPAATAKQSRAIMTSKVAALNTALTDPVLTAMLAQDQSNSIGDELSTKLAETTSLLAQMPENLADADKATQQQLYDDLTKITQLIKRQLIPTLGVQVGFNSTDGD